MFVCYLAIGWRCLVTVTFSRYSWSERSSSKPMLVSELHFREADPKKEKNLLASANERKNSTKLQHRPTIPYFSAKVYNFGGIRVL